MTKKPNDNRGIPRTRYAYCDTCKCNRWHKGVIYTDSDYWTCKKCKTHTTISYDKNNVETERIVVVPATAWEDKKLGRPPKFPPRDKP